MTDRAAMLEMYRTMCAVRAFEETGAGLVRQARIEGNLHLSIGQEAVSAGVCGVLRRTDHITTTHRGHGHCLAKGGDPERMFAELFGHADGYCRGRAGSMHIADPASGILGATAIVGGSFGIALGAAFSAQVTGEDRVAVAFFGEGAAAEGSLHEALNIASLWTLPVIFCCENNQYAELTHVSMHLAGDIPAFARAHGMAALSVDGNDALEVRAAATQAVERARAGGGPTLLEARTYRWSGHYVGDPEAYRDEEEVAAWRERDPITRLGERLATELGEAALAAVRAEIQEAIEAAAARAEGGEPALERFVLEDVYAD